MTTLGNLEYGGTQFDGKKLEKGFVFATSDAIIGKIRDIVSDDKIEFDEEEGGKGDTDNLDDL